MIEKDFELLYEIMADNCVKVIFTKPESDFEIIFVETDNAAEYLDFTLYAAVGCYYGYGEDFETEVNFTKKNCRKTLKKGGKPPFSTGATLSHTKVF